MTEKTVTNDNPPAALKAHYDTEGYAIARGVLDAELIAEARAHLDWLMQRHPDLRPEQLNTEFVRDDPFWVRLVGDDRLLDVVEPFIGPDIALFASHYIAKPPKTGQPVLWHQDGAYWPLDPMEVITVWLAVSEADPENGCMRVVPRTQDLDLKELRERGDIENVLGSGLDDSQVEADKAVDIELAPGDLSIHHPNVIHGSNANTSDRWRVGLTIRYIPTSTRITKPEIGAPFLLRGAARPGVNEYLPRPAFDPARHYAFKGAQ